MIMCMNKLHVNALELSKKYPKVIEKNTVTQVIVYNYCKHESHPYLYYLSKN